MQSLCDVQRCWSVNPNPNPAKLTLQTGVSGQTTKPFPLPSLSAQLRGCNDSCNNSHPHTNYKA